MISIQQFDLAALCPGDDGDAFPSVLVTEIERRLPPPGTDAARLTDEQRWAVAMCAGVKASSQFAGGKVTYTTEPCAITNRGDGGYIVAVKA